MTDHRLFRATILALSTDFSGPDTFYFSDIDANTHDSVATFRINIHRGSPLIVSGRPKNETYDYGCTSPKLRRRCLVFHEYTDGISYYPEIRTLIVVKGNDRTICVATPNFDERKLSSRGFLGLLSSSANDFQ